MSSVQRSELPQRALLDKYLQDGGYADCYVTHMARQVSHAEFVEAFYTTALFKIERLLLAGLVSRPSSDAEAAQLAAGTRNTFAAWSVEARSENQLLLTDFRSRTRSWLMVAPADSGENQGTRLYFGSAVVPATHGRPGKPRPGLVFRLLLGFHKLYSRALLSAARSRLANVRPDGIEDKSDP